MRLLIILFILIPTLSSAQKKDCIIEKTGLIFFSTSYTYDTSGNVNHGVDFFDATDDYFIPIKKYKTGTEPIGLFAENNLKSGIMLMSYSQRWNLFEMAEEYLVKKDISSCYFSSTFRLLPVKMRYRIVSKNEAVICSGNKSAVYVNNRLVKFSYNTWSIEIVEIKPLM